MLNDYFLSVFIGFMGAIVIVAVWVYIELNLLQYRCGKALETVILSLKGSGNTKLLPWHSTKEFLNGVEPIQRKIQSLKHIISIDNYNINLMKHSEHKLRIVIGFNVKHEGGNSIAQAILHKTPTRLLVQQLIIE